MSAVLLDTNAFSMVLAGDSRLSVRVREMIESADRVLISAVSFYEIAQKVRIGKWAEMAPLIETMHERATEFGFDLIAITPAMARDAGMLDWSHRDPFDRMIAAVALQERVAVVSSDTAFDAVGVARVW